MEPASKKISQLLHFYRHCHLPPFRWLASYKITSLPPMFCSMKSILIVHAKDCGPRYFLFLIINTLPPNVEQLDNTTPLEFMSSARLSPHSVRWMIILSHDLKYRNALCHHQQIASLFPLFDIHRVLGESKYQRRMPLEVEHYLWYAWRMSVPRYQGTSWSSQHARANRLVSISSTITLRWMGGLPSLPIQLPRHTIPVQAHIPFHNMTPRFEGDAQDRASDNTAYPSIVELQ